MSVVRVLSQICRQGVPHTRTGSRETSVAETVACAWNDADPFRRGLKLRAASVGNELNVRSHRHAGVCPARTDAQMLFCILLSRESEGIYVFTGVVLSVCLCVCL